MRLVLLSLLMLFTSLALAADNPAGQDEQTNSETDSEQAETELVLDETDSGETEESPERFIPTEEISQDLGVSFPVDI